MSIFFKLHLTFVNVANGDLLYYMYVKTVNSYFQNTFF